MWQAVKNVVASSGIGGKAGRSLGEFVELIEMLGLAGDELDLGELTDDVITKTGLIEFYQKEKG